MVGRRSGGRGAALIGVRGGVSGLVGGRRVERGATIIGVSAGRAVGSIGGGVQRGTAVGVSVGRAVGAVGGVVLGTAIVGVSAGRAVGVNSPPSPNSSSTYSTHHPTPTTHPNNTSPPPIYPNYCTGPVGRSGGGVGSGGLGLGHLVGGLSWESG